MLRSATEELSRWADQCRRWSRSARTKEQRLTLQNWERFMLQAATECEREEDAGFAKARKFTS
jgi:hypothetical protein